MEKVYENIKLKPLISKKDHEEFINKSNLYSIKTISTLNSPLKPTKKKVI